MEEANSTLPRLSTSEWRKQQSVGNQESRAVDFSSSRTMIMHHNSLLFPRQCGNFEFTQQFDKFDKFENVNISRREQCTLSRLGIILHEIIKTGNDLTNKSPLLMWIICVFDENVGLREFLKMAELCCKRFSHQMSAILKWAVLNGMRSVIGGSRKTWKAAILGGRQFSRSGEKRPEEREWQVKQRRELCQCGENQKRELVLGEAIVWMSDWELKKSVVSRDEFHRKIKFHFGMFNLHANSHRNFLWKMNMWERTPQFIKSDRLLKSQTFESAGKSVCLRWCTSDDCGDTLLSVCEKKTIQITGAGCKMPRRFLTTEMDENQISISIASHVSWISVWNRWNMFDSIGMQSIDFSKFWVKWWWTMIGT